MATGAIFKLDGRALAEKYKGAAIDYWADSRTEGLPRKQPIFRKTPKPPKRLKQKIELYWTNPILTTPTDILTKYILEWNSTEWKRICLIGAPRRPVSRTLRGGR